jgi:Trk K+ transport system NAD-binding subunit
MEDHVIVCGLDRLGMRIVDELRALGESVVVLARTPTVTFADRARDLGATLVEGSSQEEEDLREAGVETARSLVLSEDSDLGNLHAAITAQELNPKVRVVARVFSSELARRATALVTDLEVLSLASLTAPTLAAEAVGAREDGTIEVWGRLVVLRDTSADEAVLARLESDAVLTDAGMAPSAPPAVAQARSQAARVAVRALRAFFDRRLAVVMGAVFLLIVLSVTVFAIFDNLSPVDAIYFTITTISTVGYGDINLMTSSNALKLYDVGFMLCGAVALAAFLALVTDAIVGARLSEALGVPHGRMKGHVIVCGLGDVGFRVVEHLVHDGLQVAACDINERGKFVQLARRMGVPVLVGDALLPDNLRILGVEHARAVIAATNDDVVNVEVMMNARDMGPEARLVARVFDQKLADRAEQRFGIHACHSVSALAAPYFAGAALGDDVNTVVHVGDQVWLVAERTVTGGSPAAGMPVSAFDARGEVALLAVRDGAEARWGPERAHAIQPGQDLLAATTIAGLERLRALTPG